MKLSMWMIANRLSSFDMDISIKEDAIPCLYSARLAHATNCVYIHGLKNDVVCEHDGSKIVLHNMGVTEAFETIQGVFDYYQQWHDNLETAISMHDFQRVVDISTAVFQNPINILDGNCKVLGLSQISPKDMDKEWKYLVKHGYSSMVSVQAMRLYFGSVFFQKHGYQMFSSNKNTSMGFSGISYCMYSNEVACGRITVLEKDRPLNHGDQQLVSFLASLLEPVLGLVSPDMDNFNNNCIYSLLHGNSYDEQDLSVQMSYYQWDYNDSYQVCQIQLGDEFYLDNKMTLNMLLHILQSQINDAIIIQSKPYVTLLSHSCISSDKKIMDFLSTSAKDYNVKLGFSLYSKGLLNSPVLLDQATAAIHYGSLNNPNERLFLFWNYAVEYMLSSNSFEKSVSSCHPAIVALYKAKKKDGDDLFDTLKLYLDYERSISKISALLYTHRNTILYRIKKVREMIPEDFDEPSVRSYLRVSITILELADKSSSEIHNKMIS